MVEPQRANSMLTDANGPLRGAVVIVNPNGLHLRPAMAFARRAQAYACTVQVSQGERTVNGKSMIDLMLLAAEAGTELVVEVAGHDAHAALPALMEILAAPAAEELDVEPAAPNE